MSYVLVLLFSTAFHGNGPVAITTVAGYTSKAACEAAAKEYVSRASLTDARAICIPKQ